MPDVHWHRSIHCKEVNTVSIINEGKRKERKKTCEVNQTRTNVHLIFFPLLRRSHTHASMQLCIHYIIGRKRKAVDTYMVLKNSIEHHYQWTRISSSIIMDTCLIEEEEKRILLNSNPLFKLRVRFIFISVDFWTALSASWWLMRYYICMSNGWELFQRQLCSE